MIVDIAKLGPFLFVKNNYSILHLMVVHNLRLCELSKPEMLAVRKKTEVNISKFTFEWPLDWCLNYVLRIYEKSKYPMFNAPTMTTSIYYYFSLLFKCLTSYLEVCAGMLDVFILRKRKSVKAARRAP